MPYPIPSPIAPMLARLSEAIPFGEDWLFEPKWDGFRALVFRSGAALYLQSRELRPLNRYFPELEAPLLLRLPERCVADGEIVIAGERGLDFEALLLRIHPASSRVRQLARQTPASLVLFDLLALGDSDLRAAPFSERRRLLEGALRPGPKRVLVTPATRDRALASDWFSRFEGAGLDGVVAKRLGAPYQPGVRAMVKVKHARTADCVVAGFRWHKRGPGAQVGSLLLGLYDLSGSLQHAGICSAFSTTRGKELARELAPLREGAATGHPWRDIPEGSIEDGFEQRLPGAPSRWNHGKDLSWEPLRPERACEVAYDHLQGDRFRHATHFVRWRPDKSPRECTYEQLEEAPPLELGQIFHEQA